MLVRDRTCSLLNCLIGRKEKSIVSGSICRVECGPLCGLERGQDLYFDRSVGFIESIIELDGFIWSQSRKIDRKEDTEI